MEKVHRTLHTVTQICIQDRYTNTYTRPSHKYVDMYRRRNRGGQVLVFAGHSSSCAMVRREEGIPPSYARMNMQPLVDKLRSADMIVRESFGNEQQHMYCLVSISEKRQKAVAEVMGDGALRLRLKKKDDMGNAIKNGGGW